MGYPRVLVPVDFSTGSAAVAQLAVALVPLGVEEVVLLHILDTSGLESPVATAKRRDAQADMDALIGGLDTRGVTVTGEIQAGTAPACIIRRTGQLGIDLIVIGSTGKKALEELVLGSLSVQVTREARIPVLFTRFSALEDRTPEELIALAEGLTTTILHPTDFSEASGHSLDSAVDLRPHRLILGHAVDDEGVPPEEVVALEATAARRLETIRDRLERSGVVAEVRVGKGNPVGVMLELAQEESITMIALGSTGKGVMSETIVGNVSREILRDAPVPALVVH
jgi:nucleotide-binding universal stress UspA family protein